MRPYELDDARENDEEAIAYGLVLVGRDTSVIDMGKPAARPHFDDAPAYGCEPRVDAYYERGRSA